MDSQLKGSERTRAETLFAARLGAHVGRIDRLFAHLMVVQWFFGVVLAVLLSPLAWAGKTHVIHMHVYIAVLFGGLLSAMPVALAIFRPAWLVTRMAIACAQMMWSGLLIHLSGGRIETHFHIFVSLAFLALYRDWRVLVPATVIVVVDHVVRQLLWPESIFGVLAPEPWRFLEHTAWVVFEDAILIISCIGAQREMRRTAEQQTTIELRERTEKDLLANELQIASRIQLAMLPRVLDVRGLECAARMLTATAVGGDYYELLPTADGCWIGIGDVAGHGLQAGLVMLQVQSTIEALVLNHPDAAPGDVLAAANRVLFENVRRRSGSDTHVTLSLMRYRADGRLLSVGAHEEALIWRAASGRCECIPIEGTWLGVVEDIGPLTVQTTHALARGDLLVLYTDGVIEALNERREMFGLERVIEIVEAHATDDVKDICGRVIGAASAWTRDALDDDMTVMVLRQVGPT